MSSDELRLLTEIKEQLVSMGNTLSDMREDMRSDRTWMWRILALTIIGAFALIGVKLAVP